MLARWWHVTPWRRICGVCARFTDTGTDFAWAWNAPLLRIPTTSTRHILLTSGRAFALSVGGGLLSLLLRSAPLRNVIVAWSVFVYALLTTLTWPQRWSRAALPPSAPVATA